MECSKWYLLLPNIIKCIPWGSEYDLEQLKDIDKIKIVLKRIGDYANEHGVRLSCHPVLSMFSVHQIQML